MAITVEMVGAESVQRSLTLLRNGFPREADRATSDAAKRARTEFVGRVRKITTVKFRRAQAATGQVLKRQVGGLDAYGFEIKKDRPGVQHFEVRSLGRRRKGRNPQAAPILFRIYRDGPGQGIRRAIRLAGREDQGYFARAVYRPGLPASRRGVPAKRAASGLVHRLPLFRIQGPSMASLWEKRPDLRAAVVRRGQTALAFGVNTRLARLMSQGRI